eukprot:5776063-Alexandrium_andersonii.AAC.1
MSKSNREEQREPKRACRHPEPTKMLLRNDRQVPRCFVFALREGLSPDMLEEEKEAAWQSCLAPSSA